MTRAGIIAMFLWLQQEPVKDCPMSEIKSGLYCETCKIVLEDDTIIDRGYCKKCCEGLDPKDRIKAATVEVCVRTYFEASCHPGEKSLTPGLHCGRDMELKVSRARVVHTCGSCAKTHDKAGTCCDMPLRIRCSRSGVFPHTTP